MPFIGLSLGYAASIFATPVYASGSDADDSDAAADEPGGESRADFVAWDPQSLRAPAAAPLPPNAAALDERALAVCPLITRTRTPADFERNVAAVVGGNRDPARFNVPYSDLEVDDFAFVLAQPGSQGAFTLRVRGRLSPLVELLSIRALVAPRKVNPPPL